MLRKNEPHLNYLHYELGLTSNDNILIGTEVSVFKILSHISLYMVLIIPDEVGR